MTRRLSPQICITLDPFLIEQMAKYGQQLGMRRSTIIQTAIREWLVANRVPEGPKFVGSKLYDPHKDFRYYMRPGMTVDEHLQLLDEYEAARKAK
ncbi:MAG: hypothetical protein JWO41_948 [Candidatus Saccharibacteria bacterium]|nr:hypothetical protein [Candidatus Saccharibacteria bacterium]